MRNKNIADAFASFEPTEEQKERIYGKVASGQPSADKKARRGRIAFACAAAAYAVIAAVAAILLNGRGGPDNTALLESNGAQTSEPGVSGVSPAGSAAFSGFVFTAYRPARGTEYLNADFEEDAEQLVLTPYVEVLLGEYSPLMSSVPGLPFTVGLPDGSSACVIRVSVGGGALYEWDQATGIVTQKGNTAEIAMGGTIYWSPVISEGGADISSATITVEAVEDGVIVGRQQIVITCDEQGYYYAMAGEPETI